MVTATANDIRNAYLEDLKAYWHNELVEAFDEVIEAIHDRGVTIPLRNLAPCAMEFFDINQDRTLPWFSADAVRSLVALGTSREIAEQDIVRLSESVRRRLDAGAVVKEILALYGAEALRDKSHYVKARIRRRAVAQGRDLDEVEAMLAMGDPVVIRVTPEEMEEMHRNGTLPEQFSTVAMDKAR